jgi:hypothetical protein
MKSSKLKLPMGAARVAGAVALILAASAWGVDASAKCVPGTTVYGRCTQEPPPPPPPPPKG